jgi:hypothetical protein
MKNNTTLNNRKINQQSIIILLCIALIAAIGFTLFLNADSQRSWANHADQELTLAYNAVILLSGGHQETYDHTGFLTMYLLGKYMQLKSLSGASIILSADQLNTVSYFETFKQLVSYSREFAAISIIALVSCIFLVLTRLGMGSTVPLIISLAYFFSSGVLVHFEQLRTEPISLIILLLAAYTFSAINNFTNKFDIAKILISLTLLNIAIVNKIQVFIFCLIYFYAFMLLNNRSYYLDSKSTTQEGKTWPSRAWDYYLSVLLLLMYCLLSTIGRSRLVSVLIMIIFFIAASALLSIQLSRSHLQGIRNFQLHFSIKFCALYAISLLGAFLILMPISWDPLIFHQVVNPSGIAIYMDKEKLSVESISKLFSSPLPYFIDKNNTPRAFIIGIFATIIAGYRSLVKFDFWALIFFVGAYYFVEISSTMRALAPHYKLYSETLLVLGFAYFLHLIPNKRLRIAISLALLAATVAVTGNSTLIKLRTNLGHERVYCTTSYISDWHQQLNNPAFYRECTEAGLRTPDDIK